MRLVQQEVGDADRVQDSRRGYLSAYDADAGCRARLRGPSLSTRRCTCSQRQQSRHWLSSRNADDFPYDAVVAEFHRVGKHFVATELLEALAAVRAALPEMRGSVTSVRLLDRFLDAALDKWDGRYANPTYLGLSLLPLPAVDDLSHDITAAQRQYDRLFVQLIADAMRFELAAADGATELLPQMRPDARTTAKRCRLGLQVAGPAARRLGLADGVDVADPIAGARRLWANLAADLSPAERRTLQLTMLPVSLIHDEYQFIRVLQSFEATFALIAVQLQAAVRALTDGESALALQCILAAERALHEAAPLWSLVATMQVEAFQTFREFTEGASAIQSRNYKLVESLCRQPDRSSPGFRRLSLRARGTGARAGRPGDPGRGVPGGPRRRPPQLRRRRRPGAGDAAICGDAAAVAQDPLPDCRADARGAHRHGLHRGRAVPQGGAGDPGLLVCRDGEDAEDAEARDLEGGEIAPAQTLEVIGARGRCPFAA